jgi:hypothetical protein
VSNPAQSRAKRITKIRKHAENPEAMSLSFATDDIFWLLAELAAADARLVHSDTQLVLALQHGREATARYHDKAQQCMHFENEVAFANARVDALQKKISNCEALKATIARYEAPVTDEECEEVACAFSASPLNIDIELAREVLREFVSTRMEGKATYERT